MAQVIQFGKPLDVHIPFHRSAARFRVAFGAAGSGKSYAGCDESIAWALEEPGIVGMITRKHTTDLRDSTEKVFLERMPDELLAQCKLTRTGGHYDTCYFPNGSEIWFRGLDEWEKKKSANLGFVFMDEMTDFSEDDFHGMRTRLRQRDRTPTARLLGYTSLIERQGLWGATNPKGKDWVWRNFHPDSPKRLAGTAAFFSTTLDNPFLGEDYVTDLLTMPKLWVARYVLCQFDDFAGRIYELEFTERNIVPRPRFELHQRVPVWMGMDPGTAAPTAVQWAWVDAANSRLVILEDYEEPGLSADVHADAWRMIERLHRMNVEWRVSDPNAISQRSRETMIKLQDAYRRLGFNFVFGTSDEDTRIWQLGRALKLGRVVYADNCTRSIEAVRNYQYEDLTPSQRAKELDPTERVLKRNTHLVEVSQWLAGRLLPLPTLAKYRTTPRDLKDEVWAYMRQQRVAPRSDGRTDGLIW